MAVTNYYTVNGKIRGEGTAEDGYRPYGHDALGSVVATYDSTGALQNTYRNAPYGTQVAKTGTAPDPAFLYNGGSGYRTTGRSYSPYYVRKRHFDNKSAQWTTVDALWPGQPAYVYVGGRPILATDPKGTFIFLIAAIAVVFVLTIENTGEGNESHVQHVKNVNTLSTEKVKDIGYVWQVATIPLKMKLFVRFCTWVRSWF